MINFKKPILPKIDIYKTDRFSFALAKLKACGKMNGEVYDLGAGKGLMQKKIENLGFQWFGFDISPAKKSIKKWDLNRPCPQGEKSCDVIILLEVIEHLNNVERSLQNIRRAMRKKGILILTTPNPRWSRSRLHALKTGYLSCFTPSDLEWNHHVFTPWPHIVADLLRKSGFTILEYASIEGPTTYWPKNPFGGLWLFKVLGNLTCRLIEKRDSTACGMSYGIVARAD